MVAGPRQQSGGLRFGRKLLTPIRLRKDLQRQDHWPSRRDRLAKRRQSRRSGKQGHPNTACHVSHFAIQSSQYIGRLNP